MIYGCAVWNRKRWNFAITSQSEIRRWRVEVCLIIYCGRLIIVPTVVWKFTVSYHFATSRRDEHCSSYKHNQKNRFSYLFSLISSLNKRNYTLVAISIHRNTILYKSKNIQLTAKNNTVLPTHWTKLLKNGIKRIIYVEFCCKLYYYVNIFSNNLLQVAHYGFAQGKNR